MQARPYDVFFAGLFFLAEVLAVLLGAGVPLALGAAAGFTGACLFTAAFLRLAASFAGAAVSAFAAAGAVPLAALVPFAALLIAPLGANFDPLPPLRPHLPRSGAAASRAWHSSSVRLLGSLSFGIFALRALSVM